MSLGKLIRKSGCGGGQKVNEIKVHVHLQYLVDAAKKCGVDVERS